MKRAHILLSILTCVLFVIYAPRLSLGEGAASGAGDPGKGASPPAGVGKKGNPDKPKSGATAPVADDAIPKRLDYNRYAGMIDRSPFAVATAAAPVVGPPAWSKDLFIANAGHTPEGDSDTIMSLSDKNMKEYISTEKPNDHGYGIANIEWSDNPGGTKVTISKDGQFATIGFNEATVTQGPPQTQPPQAVPNMPNVPAAAKTQPGVAPQPNLPAPHVRGLIQRTRQVPGITPNPPPPSNAAALEAPDS